MQTVETAKLECLESCRALAQRLESTHEWCIVQYARSLALHVPAAGAECLPIAGGTAIYTGPSPFTFAVGMGMEAGMSSHELDQVEAFFARHRVPSAIEVCPFTDLSLLELLQQRGYRASSITTVLWRELQDEDLGPIPPEIEVRWAEDRDLKTWMDMLATSFFVAEPGPRARAGMAALFRVPNSLSALALLNGEVAGVAGGMLPEPGSTAPFFGSCTRPEFRRCGVHAALLRFRLQRARQHGCPSVMATTIPGSDSERNLQRHGFSVAYEKLTWVRK